MEETHRFDSLGWHYSLFLATIFSIPIAAIISTTF
jgi:hypothetical protein